MDSSGSNIEHKFLSVTSDTISYDLTHLVFLLCISVENLTQAAYNQKNNHAWTSGYHSGQDVHLPRSRVWIRIPEKSWMLAPRVLSFSALLIKALSHSVSLGA